MAEQGAFPFSMSINEPQTVSLPLPSDVTTPLPVITALEPASCTIGDPSFTLVVSGEEFQPYSIIVFAGHNEPTTYDEEAGTLSTGINMDVWNGPDTVPVLVRTGNADSEPMSFEFLAATGDAREVYDEEWERKGDDDNEIGEDKPGGGRHRGGHAKHKSKHK